MLSRGSPRASWQWHYCRSGFAPWPAALRPGPGSYAPARPINSDSAVAQAQRDAQDRQINEQQRQAYLANQQYQRDLQARQAREQQQNAQPASSNPVDQIADKVRAEQQKAENAGMLTPTN